MFIDTFTVTITQSLLPSSTCTCTADIVASKNCVISFPLLRDTVIIYHKSPFFRRRIIFVVARCNENYYMRKFCTTHVQYGGKTKKTKIILHENLLHKNLCDENKANYGIIWKYCMTCLILDLEETLKAANSISQMARRKSSSFSVLLGNSTSGLTPTISVGWIL